MLRATVHCAVIILALSVGHAARHFCDDARNYDLVGLAVTTVKR